MSSARPVLLALTLVLSIGCDPRRGSPDAAAPGRDAPMLDAFSLDAREGPDSGRLDVGLGPDAALDASRIDAPPPLDAFARDARTEDAHALDARAPDARAPDAPSPSPDARSIDAGPTDAGRAGTILECAPPVPSSATAGLVFSPMFWPGFRFEITSSSRVTAVGLQLTPSSPGTVSAAIVRLSGPSDAPDAPDLTGSDVLVRTDVTLSPSATPIIARGSVDFTLGTGWYALVFASGAHGATSSGGSLPSAGGAGCRSMPASGFPFSIRQSDGTLILQGAEPHLFVELAP